MLKGDLSAAHLYRSKHTEAQIINYFLCRADCEDILRLFYQMSWAVSDQQPSQDSTLTVTKRYNQ